MEFQRARSEKNKETRMNEIITASSEIYDEKKFNGLTFEAIAKRLNATRPLIYNYFSTKEEVVAVILSMDVAQWAKDLKKTFKSGEKYDINEIADMWAECLMRHGRMVELYSIMHTVLEKNMSSEKLDEVRTKISESKESMIKLISKLVPELDYEKSSFFFDTQMSLAVGIYPIYSSTRNITDVTKECIGTYGRSIRIILVQLKDGKDAISGS
ncbi:MAG: TetR/AcrR family transcriptional regulator [Candidatus Methanogranum gryphiswaldense]|nr:MAG: TetR/AcrR family transcriptional regulator [Candidatus Methanogranum sp. U3.2.1]